MTRKRGLTWLSTIDELLIGRFRIRHMLYHHTQFSSVHVRMILQHGENIIWSRY